ncbi:unnamed protein product [Cylindrotheca closterium]|uniref:Uncharacterized protein n=1 Tax=Cylindrotheca closterium TaxID=2856 RepID=A0AAD2JHV8_9STRA|nr:unnamed protein product [Cylindrotheca closterium]
MYAIFHQIDREKKVQEEKENEQNVLIEELKQLEAKYNGLLRRDSFSTITTQDTGILIETTTQDRKQLLPIIWGKNGKLPIEISVPETRLDKNLLGSYDYNVEADGQAYRPPPEGKDDDALHILQNSLFVDDDEELALIFDDNNEDEMNVQRTKGNRAPLEVSLASSSENSLFVDDDEELALIFDDNHEDEMNVQRTKGNRASLEVSLASSSESSNSSFSESNESSLYTSTTSCDSEDLLRFERERFTRFEI